MHKEKIIVSPLLLSLMERGHLLIPHALEASGADSLGALVYSVVEPFGVFVVVLAITA
jgi:hypothetical protein